MDLLHLLTAVRISLDASRMLRMLDLNSLPLWPAVSCKVTLGDYLGLKKSLKNHRYRTNNRLQKYRFIYVNRIGTCIDFFFYLLKIDELSFFGIEKVQKRLIIIK